MKICGWGVSRAFFGVVGLALSMQAFADGEQAPPPPKTLADIQKETKQAQDDKADLQKLIDAQKASLKAQAEYKELDDQAKSLMTLAPENLETFRCMTAAAEQEEGGALGEFAATIAGDTTLVSADLFSGYSKFTENWGSLRPKALGFRISSSVPADAATLPKYADAQLALRDGGLLNAYLSLTGSPYWYVKNDPSCRAIGFARPFVPDRQYLAVHPVSPLMRAYLTHGVGIKAIKTGLKDDEATDEDSSGLAAAGVAYLGVGVNGPVWDAKGNGTDASGMLDLQIYVAGARMNEDTLSKLYAQEVDEPWVLTAGVRFDLFVTNVIAITAEYAAPFDNAKDFVDSVTLFSVKYNPAKK